MIEEIKISIQRGIGDDVLDVNNIVEIKWKIEGKECALKTTYSSDEVYLDRNEICEILNAMFQKIIKDPKLCV